jgi:hypothetical protein
MSGPEEVVGALLCVFAVLWMIRGLELLIDLITYLIWGPNE